MPKKSARPRRTKTRTKTRAKTRVAARNTRNNRPRGTPGSTSGAAPDLADRLHSAALHLMRRLRREDDASGLPAPQLSALSVIVFAGPVTLGALAAAEQVRPPTITKLVAALERDGLVKRVSDEGDRRVVRVQATARGARLLSDGRQRRVASLTASLDALAANERDALARAIPILESVARCS